MQGASKPAFQMQVPGKIMLTGEYAVLFGAEALACSVDAGLGLTVRYRPSGGTRIHSDLWDSSREYPERLYQGSPPDPDLVDFFMRQYSESLPGAEIRIDGGLHPRLGVGSSSALLMALVCAARVFADGTRPAALTWQDTLQAIALQRLMQGLGSGYDFITQYFGGLISTQARSASPSMDFSVRQFPYPYLDCLNSYCLVFANFRGAPTQGTARPVLAKLQQDPAARTELLRLTGQHVQALLGFLANPMPNFQAFVDATKTHRKFFRGFSNYPAWLEAVEAIEGCDRRWTFKLSGAGGEDALLFFALPGDHDHLTLELAALDLHPCPIRFSANRAKLLEIP